MPARPITISTAIVSWILLAYGQPVPAHRGLNLQGRLPRNSRRLHEARTVASPTSVWNSAKTADSRDHRVRHAASPPTPSYVISTVAGSDRLHDGGTATVAPLRSPAVVVADSAGTFYIGDIHDYRVRKVAGGTISTYAGVGFQGYSGDGLAGRQAAIGLVTGMALDGAGNLYLADWDNERVRKISPSGVITTIAGNGTFFFEGDGIPATTTAVDPFSVAVDGHGNIYIADVANSRIRKVTAAGIISTIAGNGVRGYTGDGGLATAAQIDFASGIAVDSGGNIYFTDYAHKRVRKIDPAGIVTTVAGNGNSKFAGDGRLATVAQLDPINVAVDGAGNLYIADWTNNRVRKITASTGLISTVAGNGDFGLKGDGGPATNASISNPLFVSIDASGNLYIADQGNDRIRKVTPDGNISSIAGAPVGDGGPATSAFLDFPVGVTVDGQGDLLIADGNNNRIRKVMPSGTISTLAGIGVSGYSSAGPAPAAMLAGPGATAFDANGNVYIADTYNYRIRKVSPDGKISNVAGTGQSNFSGDGGPAATAGIGAPAGIVIDPSGNIYFTDQDFYRIRKIDPSGFISTIAGNGSQNFNGDGGPAIVAQLDPVGIALDQNGNLYVADVSNNRIRKIDTTGNISTVAGTDASGFGGDGGPATAASLSYPTGVAVDHDGNLYIADYGNFVVRWVSKTGVISTIAGNGADYLIAGDGGQALAAQLDPIAVAVSGATVYIADAINDRVRMLTLQTPASLTLSGGDNQSGIAGTLLPAALNVTVTDQSGIPVVGVAVTFAVTAGSATLDPASAVTGPDGIASTRVTLGASAGSITITATVSGLTVATFHLTATAAPPPATIFAGGVVGAGLSVPPVKAISPNGILSVFGQNFAPAGTLHQVGKAEMVNGQLPTNVMNVCVLVGSTTPAPIFALTDTQVNFQAPALPPSGTISVQVATACGTGNQVVTNAEPIVVQAAAPEFFYFKPSLDGKNPIAAVNAVSGAYIGAPGLLAGVTFVPAKPRDVLTLFLTGLGATSPAFAPGVLPDKAASVVGDVKIQIASVVLASSDVLYAGVTPGYAGLYQINLRVPDSVPDGDQEVEVTVGGFTSPAGAFLTVKR